MASEPIRDPAKDHLLTPKNSALIIIDYQPAQVNSIASMDRQRLIDNIVGVVRLRALRDFAGDCGVMMSLLRSHISARPSACSKHSSRFAENASDSCVSINASDSSNTRTTTACERLEDFA